MEGPIKLKQTIPAVLIPDGVNIVLEKGRQVTIQQTLGGSFTVLTDNGCLARIEGKYAEALGKKKEEVEKKYTVNSKADLEKLIWDELRTCYDPEIPVDIVELGLVYKCEVKEIEKEAYKVAIEMTLTAPGCGMGPVLQQEVLSKILKLPKVKEASVDLVWEPPWTQERMSEAAKLKLGLL